MAILAGGVGAARDRNRIESITRLTWLRNLSGIGLLRVRGGIAAVASYSFVTTWRLHAPIEEVWEALNCPDRYHEWWPSIVAYQKLNPEVTGVGAKAERSVRGRLPYTLRYQTTTTRVDPPRELAYEASGDLVGQGRFVLSEQGEWTEVVFYWDVQTSGFWMNLLAPVLRWLFAWNHNQVMAQGERGLTNWLARHGGAVTSRRISMSMESPSPQNRVATPALYPLLDALLQRRSRRFGKGMCLNGGPLAYRSTQPPKPLTLEEEALLAFAACGVTGYALAELPYQTGDRPEAGSGNIMTHFIGRTVPSGDAMHDCAVFVINDQGTWLLRRPQDFPRPEIPDLVQAARRHRFVELYEKSRVRVADHRVDLPREWPFVAPFNKYSANVPGTTYFFPVVELTALYVNVMLSFFDDEFTMFAVDDHNGYQPAGIARFARSAGGHLQDDPKSGRVATMSGMETWICEFCAIEMGGILQNLGLMTTALGLGGFPHFAAHPVWLQALGFRTEEVAMSKLMGLPTGSAELSVPVAVGLERDGEALLKPFCPPYYKDMEEAVLAFVDYKYAPGRGTFRDGGAASAWKDGATVQANIPKYPDHTIAATIAYCDYIYQRYGRLPGTTGPFRTLLAYQAHHLDTDFYDKFYRPEALSETQRQHGDV
jgi:uncharacterized protein YndB with AHSA1/START domain